MSLINDVLRNIEAKRPDELARHKLSREIRSLPAGKRGYGGILKRLLGLGAVLALGVAAYYASGQFDEVRPVLAPPPPAPSLVTPPPMAASEPPPVVTAATLPFDDNLRLSAELAAVPLPVAPVLGVPDPVVPQPAAVRSDAVTAAAPAPALPSGPVKIEKSPLAPTVRDKADAEFRRAETALASGRSGEALEGLRAALKIDPGYVAVRQALLRQLLDARKTDEAMVVLQDGLNILPTQTGWAVSLARLQFEHGELNAADRTLTRSQGYAEANADYAGFQGHLKSRLGAPRQAIAHYQRATRLAPGEGRWWLGLGLAFEADGRVGEARDALRRALATGTLNAELAAVAEQHLRQ
jgi:MSHA biogenesis protein MshN